uniref:Uncharacterized protein n=1 Tax=Arundo donax TaxID=35708 RepID=A0A0A9A8R2_ARUDO
MLHDFLSCSQGVLLAYIQLEPWFLNKARAKHSLISM